MCLEGKRVADNEGINQNQTVSPDVDQRLQTKLIAETIEGLDDCKAFAEWVRSNELLYALRRGGLRTLFVPSDQGFQAPGSEDAEEFLNRHLLTGGFESFDLSRCERVKTIGGQTLPVSDGGMRIGGARIVRANVPCTNGVIHIVDAEPQPAPAS
jgi:uncharacterized surface protein with fasciclin (FAS1) repeats